MDTLAQTVDSQIFNVKTKHIKMAVLSVSYALPDGKPSNPSVAR